MELSHFPTLQAGAFSLAGDAGRPKKEQPGLFLYCVQERMSPTLTLSLRSLFQEGKLVLVNARLVKVELIRQVCVNGVYRHSHHSPRSSASRCPFNIWSIWTQLIERRHAANTCSRLLVTLPLVPRFPLYILAVELHSRGINVVIIISLPHYHYNYC